MENISLVTWDQVLLLDKHLASEWKQMVDSVNIHEMAHRWRFHFLRSLLPMPKRKQSSHLGLPHVTLPCV